MSSNGIQTINAIIVLQQLRQIPIGFHKPGSVSSQSRMMKGHMGPQPSQLELNSQNTGSAEIWHHNLIRLAIPFQISYTRLSGRPYFVEDCDVAVRAQGEKWNDNAQVSTYCLISSESSEEWTPKAWSMKERIYRLAFVNIKNLLSRKYTLKTHKKGHESR